MKLIIVSGGFDPIHSGHIAYFESAKSHGDKLVVALNSDSWLEKKKGKFFMPFDERKAIVESIKFVDQVIGFKDDTKGSCINALETVKKLILIVKFILLMVAIEIKKIYQKCLFQG